jgi:cell division septation protein DedD
MLGGARCTIRRVLALTALLALVTSPVAAQTYRTGVALTGGWSTAGDLTPGLGSETVFEDGWTAGAQLEVWAGRFGTRLNADYATRSLKASTRSFRMASADLALAFRLLSPRRDHPVAPFLGLGVGPILYSALDDGTPIGDGDYGDDPVIRLMLAPFAGVDLLTEAPAGVRVEIVDQIVLPSIGTSPESRGLPRTHHPGVRMALQIRLGGDRPGPVVRPPARPPVSTEVSTPQPAQVHTPAAQESAIYTAQVGGFWTRSAAREWERRLTARQLPVWLVDASTDGRPLVRLHVGVVDSTEDADLLAERLGDELGFTTQVVVVGPEEPVPADAIVATLRYLFPQ